MLQKINIQAGINKQVTATGGEGQWVDGDYVRFRYGSPEKIGGWAQLGDITLTGRTTAMHQFVNSDGIKYSALGTNRILYVYSGGAFYDITPIKATTTLTSAFTTTQSDATVTLTFSSDHNISKYDIILLDNFTAITNSNFAAGDFNDKVFMVATVPTSTTITIEMGSNESGSGASTSGGIRVQHYYQIGPAVEESAAGWGLGVWGGTTAGAVTSTLDGALTSGSSSIVLDDSTGFPSSGTGTTMSKKSYPDGITPNNFSVVKTTLQTAIDFGWTKTKTVDELRKSAQMTVRQARELVKQEFENTRRWEDGEKEK